MKGCLMMIRIIALKQMVKIRHWRVQTWLGASDKNWRGGWIDHNLEQAWTDGEAACLGNA